MPADLRLQPVYGVLQDQAVRHRLPGPGPFLLVPEELELGGQRAMPVVDHPAQFFLGQVTAHRHGQVHRVRAQANLAEGLGAQGEQFPAPLSGDGVDRPGRQVPHLLGAHRLDQAFGRHPVQGPVQRAGTHVRP